MKSLPSRPFPLGSGILSPPSSSFLGICPAAFPAPAEDEEHIAYPGRVITHMVGIRVGGGRQGSRLSPVLVRPEPTGGPNCGEKVEQPGLGWVAAPDH